MIKSRRLCRQTDHYPEVAQDPQHKEFYRDPYLRAYSIELSPGEETVLHRHSENTLYVISRGGGIATTGIQGSCPVVPQQSLSLFRKVSLVLQKWLTQKTVLPSRFLFYMPSRQHPVIHKAAASSDNRYSMNLIGVEIKAGRGVMKRNAFRHRFIKREIASNEFTVYSLSVPAKQTVQFETDSIGGLLIALSGYRIHLYSKTAEMQPWQTVSSGSSIFHYQHFSEIHEIRNQEHHPFFGYMIICQAAEQSEEKQ